MSFFSSCTIYLQKYYSKYRCLRRKSNFFFINVPPFRAGFFILCLLVVFFIYEQHEKSNEIYVGISWTNKSDFFIHGAELAVLEANKYGGVLGKQIKLIINIDEAETTDLLKKQEAILAGDIIKEASREAARFFAKYSSRITAVIGHPYSFMAVSAAAVYEQKKIVFIAPTATNDILTSMHFNYVFRMMPKNSAQGFQLGKYSVAKKIKRAVIFYERTEYAFELGQAFRQFAARHGIDIVLQFPFLHIENEFTELPRFIAEVKKIHKENPVDSIFIFTEGSMAKKIIHEFYKRNIEDVRFIAGNSADHDVFWNEVKLMRKKSGKYVEASTSSIFNRNNKNALVQDFKKKFTEKHSKEPNYAAALGYDSINIVLNAIKNADSSDPVDVANEIRYMSPCRGMTGRIAFDEKGDPDDKLYLMKSTAGNGFEYHDLNGDVLESFAAETASLPECASFIRKQ